MPTRGFTITTDYVLGRDYLEVRIPDEGFKEEGEFLIVHLELLPFFGAATDNDKGYMVFPDSSGAIAPFTPDHGRYARQFEEYVYGPEDYPFSEYSPMRTLNRQVPMPIFGLSYEDGAFLGVITAGEYDAKVVAAPSGYIVDYYRTNAKFVVRREYLAPLRRGANVQTVESTRIHTDRAVRYYILERIRLATPVWRFAIASTWWIRSAFSPGGWPMKTGLHRCISRFSTPCLKIGFSSIS